MQITDDWGQRIAKKPVSSIQVLISLSIENHQSFMTTNYHTGEEEKFGVRRRPGKKTLPENNLNKEPKL